MPRTVRLQSDSNAPDRPWIMPRGFLKEKPAYKNVVRGR